MPRNRLDQHFEKARAEGRKSLVLFLTAGFPRPEDTPRLARALVEGGCDVLELGVPFSDPIADGPTIQAASTEALAAGASLAGALDLVEALRGEGVEIPICLMGAFNPFLHYGLERLAERSVEAGVDGFLIPDLPVDESAEAEQVLGARGLDLIQFVSLTTPPERMRRIAEHARGFLYFYSLKGVTGTEIRITDELREKTALLREVSGGLPLAVGFGVSTAEQVRQTAEVADAVIVGSALIRLVDEYRDAPDLKQRIVDYVAGLKAAL